MRRLDEAAGWPAAGRKAETLARARAAGISVPDGFVVAADEEIDEQAIARELGRLGGERFAVRSSADVEDLPGASAAGIFASEVGVPAADVAAAIVRVRASALGGAVRAYLGARGLATHEIAMAVLVQPMVEAERLGVVHTAPVEAGDASLADDACTVDRAHDAGGGTLGAEERDPREPEWGEVTPRRVPLGDPLARGAGRLAALVGGEADVEYARTAAGPVFLQARPLSVAPADRDAARWATGDPDPAGTWVRDAEHNPEPLSPAQAGLVALANGLSALPTQRVIEGYLYVSARPPAAPLPLVPAGEIATWYAGELLPACEALLAPLEGGPGRAADLEPALAAYLEIVRRSIGQLSPSLRAARRGLDELLQRTIGEPLAAHGALLAGTGGLTLERDRALRTVALAPPSARPAALAACLARFGAYAPVWDIAVPPDDEAPERVLAAAALLAAVAPPERRHAETLALADAEARRVGDRLSSDERAELSAMLFATRAALTVAEDDDALFFRAQRAVRRPLLALGAALAAAGRLGAPDQIFDLPLDDVRAGRIDPARARAERALRSSRRLLSPPTAIRAGRPTWRGAMAAGLLAGAGTTGRAWGRAFVLRDVASQQAPPPGAVLVVESILPSLTWMIPAAAALVTDHGGALSHAATLAREYGVPAVLGTGLATRILRGGEELLVDGDAGRVYRIGGG